MKFTDKTKKWIRLGCDLAVSVMIIVSGILFAIACYTIYKTGSSPFTRESIAAAFGRIAVPVYVTLSLIVIGFGVHIAFPREEDKLRGARSPRALVEKLAARVEPTVLSGDMGAGVTRERRLRRYLDVIRAVLVVLSAILPLILLLNPNTFPAVSGEYNAEISHGMLVYLAFLAPLAVFEVSYVFLYDASFMREYELLKEAVKLAQTSEKAEEPASLVTTVKRFFRENEKPIILGVRIALVGCAIVFIAIGILNGGMADVLNKAINICTECIGLG